MSARRMELAQTRRIEGSPKKADNEQAADDAAAPAPQHAHGLSLALNATVLGVKAPWVTAGLRSAGLTPAQISSITPPHGATAPATVPKTAADLGPDVHPGVGTAVGTLSSLDHESGHAAAAAGAHDDEIAVPAHAPAAAPPVAAPVVSPDLAVLHEAGAAVSQQAHAAVAAQTKKLEATAKKLAAGLRSHYATIGKQLDSHHDAQVQKVQAAFATQKAQLAAAAATAHRAVDEGEQRARLLLVQQEQEARAQASAMFDALPAAYQAQGDAAQKTAASEYGEYQKLAQQKKQQDPDKPTLLAGDMAQKRLDARLDAGKSVYEQTTKGLTDATQKRVSALHNPSDPTRAMVLGSGADGGLIGKTMESVGGENGVGGQVGDLHDQLSAGIDKQLAQLMKQLEHTEAVALKAIDAGRKRGHAELTTAQKAGASALSDAVKKNSAALGQNVTDTVNKNQSGIRKGTSQAQTTLAAIDKLLAQPNVAKGPAGTQLRLMRTKVMASVTTTSAGLKGHTNELGAQVGQGGAQVATSLEEVAKQSRQHADQQLAGQVKAIDAAGAHAITEVAAFSKHAAQEMNGVTTHAGAAFAEFVEGVPKQLAGLNAQVQTALDGQAADFGKALNEQVRDGGKRPMYEKMVSEGEQAAAAVQPRWKSIAKWVVIAIVTIAVVVAAIFLAPLVIGLAAGVLGAGLLATVVGGAVFGAVAGAVAGTAIQVGSNAIDMAGVNAPKDASGQPLTLTSGVMGWKGAMFTGVWTGALGGAIGGGVGQVLSKLPIWAFIADQVVNVGIDGLSQWTNNGQYSMEGGIQNLLISVALGAAMVHVGRRGAIRQEARTSGVEPPAATNLGGSALDHVADFTTRLGQQGHAMGESLGQKIGGKPATPAVAPTAAPEAATATASPAQHETLPADYDPMADTVAPTAAAKPTAAEAWPEELPEDWYKDFMPDNAAPVAAAPAATPTFDELWAAYEKSGPSNPAPTAKSSTIIPEGYDPLADTTHAPTKPNNVAVIPEDYDPLADTTHEPTKPKATSVLDDLSNAGTNAKTWLNETATKIKASLGLGPPAIEPVPAAEATAKLADHMNAQLQRFNATDIDQVIDSFPENLREQARAALGQASEFGNMESFNDLRSAVDEWVKGNKVLYTPGGGSLGDNMAYLQKKGTFSKTHAGNLLYSNTLTPESFVLLDDVMLHRLQSDPALAQELLAKKIPMLEVPTFDGGVNMFNSGSVEKVTERLQTLMARAQEIVSEGKGGVSLEAAVKTALSERSNAVLDSVNPKLKLEAVPYTSGGAKPDLSSEALAQRLNGGSGTTADKLDGAFKSAKLTPHEEELVRQMLTENAQLFSARRLATELESAQQDIAAQASRRGIPPEKVFYLIPESEKSYGMLAMIHRQATGTSAGQYLSGIEAVKLLPHDTMVVVFDDVAGSGQSLAWVGSDLKQNYQGAVVMKPIMSTEVAVGAVKKNLALGADYSPMNTSKALRESDFYKNLSHADQVTLDSVLGARGWDDNSLSMAFPYMAPDNNNGLFGDKIASSFIVNENRDAAKSGQYTPKKTP